MNIKEAYIRFDGKEQQWSKVIKELTGENLDTLPITTSIVTVSNVMQIQALKQEVQDLKVLIGELIDNRTQARS